MGHRAKHSGKGKQSKAKIEPPLPGENSRARGLEEGIVLKKGPWTSDEDANLIEYVKKYGEGNWNAVQKHSGLFRCGKSCRLRWANHLRPNLKKGAFSQEEEQLIIELHAKLGNKWARMAAHLPGRTDNEIKNYWNTRIKRRQRAGLPIYPPEVSLQALSVDHDLSRNVVSNGDNIHQHPLEMKCFEMPEIQFNHLKSSHAVLPYLPEAADASTIGLVSKDMCSLRCNSFMLKGIRDSMFLFPGYSDNIKDELQFFQHSQGSSYEASRSFGFSFPNDPDPDPTLNSVSFEAVQGSDTLLNCNFPASKPTIEALKPELPSFQYPETYLDGWNVPSPPDLLEEPINAFIQSPPPTGTVESDCVSPCNSGLLDVLIHEAKARSSKNSSYSSEKSFSSTTPCSAADIATPGISEAKFNECGSPFYSLGHSPVSFFSDHTPTSDHGTSLDGPIPVIESVTGENVKSEPIDPAETTPSEEDSTLFDITRPDVLFTSSWLGQGPGTMNITNLMTDAISVPGNDLGNECGQKAAGTPSSQGWGLDSCAWNNMPAVCQMTELP